ncbi:Cytochrome c2 [Alphaproteobacteria bacterium SO-S41]|nr:Cytochrome c2 [Alphaproteobacteria bacterium SO-S41]
MRRSVLLAALLALAPAALAQDATETPEELGKKIFVKCAVCHAVGPDAKNKVGPVLNGVVGSVPGTTPTDFNYSQAMKDFGVANPAWTEELLNTYLEAPAKLVKGTKMAFAGLKKPEDRANVIAYLKSNP